MTNKFMKAAIAEAKKGIRSGHGGPFGSVIVKDGKIIAKAHNCVIKNNDPTCHGEMMAIRAACKRLGTHDLSGCEIYTTGYPCPMCFCALLWANVSKIYYGCSTTDTEIIGFRDKYFEQAAEQKKKELCVRIDEDQCLELYKEYAALSDKKPY